MIPSYLSTHLWMRRFSFALMLPVALASAINFTVFSLSAKSQTPGDGRALTVRADIQEANSETGVITARGNVQLYYPSRQIQATSAQAQYFSKERRIILSGNVYILQNGNSIRGETVTYLIDEGQFIATPKANTQVESIYIIADPNVTTQPSAAPETPPLNLTPAPTNRPTSAPAAPGL